MADGTLKVGEITNSAGSGNITIGSGVTVNVNRPAFLATRDSSNQTVSDDTNTKVQLNYEILDTDSAFDITTNYRFTVPSGAAGQYFIFAKLQSDSEGSTNFDTGKVFIYKNGSAISTPANTAQNEFNFLANPIREAGLTVQTIVNLAVSDYIELYGAIEAADASGGIFKQGSYMGGYKLGA